MTKQANNHVLSLDKPATAMPRRGWISLGGGPAIGRAARRMPKSEDPNPNTYDVRILQALRRVMRATDMHSRKLSSEYQVTTPQLVALHYLREHGPMTMRSLAEGVHLSASTLVGIVDRLESKGLVQRERGHRDRRQVFIVLTGKGNTFLKQAPSPLQSKLAEALGRIPEEEQAAMAEALEHIVDLMEAGDIDAAPVLHGGAIQTPE